MTESFEPEASSFARDEDALLVGLDMGTSRSAIASINGVRKVVESYVGWPKDPVALRHLKKEVVFGTEALDNRLSLNLFRPLEKGVLKCSLEDEESEDAADSKVKMGNKQAAKELIRHLIHLTKPERDQKVYGVIGVPAQASIKSKQAMLEAAKDSMDAVMLVSQPFAVAYGMGMLDASMVVDIGAGTVDIVRMHGTVPAEDDQISLTRAGDFIDHKFAELLQTKYPQAQFTVNMLKRIKESHAFVAGEVERVVVKFPTAGKPVDYDVTDELKTASESIIDEVDVALHKLISSFDPEFQTRLRSNIIISGGGSQIIGLPSRLAERLEDLGGANVYAVEEPVYAGANGALQLAIDMPDEYWQKLS
ncbi:MAG TPA: MamK family actin-like protein [Planctomycetota bacterium]|nr:MamK family actin-like protein [Planctomycetota bacterium]